MEKNVSENMKSYSKMILNYIVYQYINNIVAFKTSLILIQALQWESVRLGILREGETFLTIRFCNRFQFVMWPAESCFVSYITTLLTKVNRPFFALWNVALTCVKQSAEHSAKTLSSPSFYLFLTIPTFFSPTLFSVMCPLVAREPAVGQ